VPRLVIVAGPNGSGKTTLMRHGVLSGYLDVPSASINPDEVARELTGGGALTPEISLQAAQACDARLDAEIAAGRSVTVETVLSSDKLKRRVEAARAAGFSIALVYVTLRHPALNVARVRQRHAQGGHDVPSDRVLSRRERSHALFEWFARQADIVLVFDNTAAPVYAAGKAGGMWDLADLDRLPGDLAATIQRLAG
jgi:predicted ABC-type ATPase